MCWYSILYVCFYRAEAGGDHGSDFLQAFARILKNYYKDQPLDRIYLMVKQYMAQVVQVINWLSFLHGKCEHLNLRRKDFHKCVKYLNLKITVVPFREGSLNFEQNKFLFHFILKCLKSKLRTF